MSPAFMCWDAMANPAGRWVEVIARDENTGATVHSDRHHIDGDGPLTEDEADAQLYRLGFGRDCPWSPSIIVDGLFMANLTRHHPVTVPTPLPTITTQGELF